MKTSRREFINAAAGVAAASAAPGDAVKGKSDEEGATKSTLKFPVRYSRLYPLAGASWDDEGQYGFGQRIFEIPIEQTALVMTDCWSRGFGPKPLVPALGWLPEMNPSMRAAARSREVMESCILPVLEAARRSGMTVIHNPAGGISEKYPDFLPAKYRVKPRAKPSGDCGWDNVVLATENNASSAARLGSDWPPSDFVAQLSEQRERDSRSEKWIKAVLEWEKHELERIAPPLEPEGDDLVVGSGDQIDAIRRDRKILHLFYCGFDLNVCVILTDRGVFYMARGRG